MIFVYILIGVIVVIAFIFIYGLGSWEITANQVISMYIANKQIEPDATDEEIAMYVLDGRFNKFKNSPSGSLRHGSYVRKEELKADIEKGEILMNYNLPTIILLCLVIEQNNVFNKYSAEEFLDIITKEVRKKGLEKYI